MIVADLMTLSVKSCGIDDTLHRVAQIMWDGDCGMLPVLDSEGRPIGVVTDRDICMAAFTTGRRLWEISVSSVMSREVHAVRSDALIEATELLMQQQQVRRVPVVNAEGHAVGILSITDLARGAQRSAPATRGTSTAAIVDTLTAVCAPRHGAWGHGIPLSDGASQH